MPLNLEGYQNIRHLRPLSLRPIGVQQTKERSALTNVGWDEDI